MKRVAAITLSLAVLSVLAFFAITTMAPGQGKRSPFHLHTLEQSSSHNSPPYGLTPALGDNRYCNQRNEWAGPQRDGVAELPRACLNTALSQTPSPGPTVEANDSASLASALASVACGETITLSAGVSYVGSFTFPARSCDETHWITIRTSGPIPPEGTRITPCYAGVASLPGRPAYACAFPSARMPKIVGPPPIRIADGASHYRLIGLEITRPADRSTQGTLVIGGGPASRIILDRCWIHGDAYAETRRGVWMSGWTYSAIIDSYLSDFHCNQHGACVDSQAIAGGTGNFPSYAVKIVNNFLEAAAESVIFGGDAATSVPADLEIRRNHFFKPLNWMPGSPQYVAGIGGGGGSMIVKNLFELKSANRTLVEGNIAENVWGGFSQQGYVWVITPVNQSGQCGVCNVSDTTLRFNLSRHSAGGMAFVTNALPPGASSRRFVAHDNLMDDISNAKYQGGGSTFFFANTWPDNNYGDVHVIHNTAIQLDGGHAMQMDSDRTRGQLRDFEFSSNIFQALTYPWWDVLGNVTTDCGATDVPITTLQECWGNTWKMNSNLVVAPPPPYDRNEKWPRRTFFAAGWKAVGFVDFKGGNGGDYRLASHSAYKGKAHDGKDIGADMDALSAAIRGVE
jgi:hypothetical protein